MDSNQPRTHFLYPSGIFVHTEPYEVCTVLGSCVSVCLWDTQLKIGGINHYMLPLWNGEGLASPKYGNIAIARLVERMLLLGCNQTHLVAKVFGGAQQLEKGKSIFNISERNIHLALNTLKEAGIPVRSQNTGGEKGRKIKFYTGSGDVLMKYL